ncbi:MAG: glycosyltransferase family 2 protein, partial [Sphingomonadales bacterium]|nr:glycosyltransferase family 2 protein [Sphingomonadales bacterium]
MMLSLIALTGCIAGLGLVHTYGIYPWHMSRLAKRPQDWEPLEEFPKVILLMAAYNEEAMIQAKIQSIFRNHYPKSRLAVVVGTDACTDGTDMLL